MASNSDELTIELHKEFFDNEWLMVKDLDNSGLDDRIRMLERIAFEARARLNRDKLTVRERDANAKRDGNWLVSHGNDPTVTDAISVVKERKARQTKADKNLELMRSLGIDNADELVANMERKQSGRAITSTSSRIIEDKRPPVVVQPVSSNTQASLLNDLAEQVTKGIDTRPIDNLVSEAKTMGHIANKILGIPTFSPDSITQQSNKTEGGITLSSSEEKPFNPDDLFK